MPSDWHDPFAQTEEELERVRAAYRRARVLDY